jgi:hypothetical protein
MILTAISPVMAPVQRNIVQDSYRDYYSWNNTKNRVALELAASQFKNSDGSNSPMNAAMAGAATWLTLTAGQKAAGWYSHQLDKNEALSDFRYKHPIIGNLVAWTPGAALVGGVLSAGYFGYRAFRQHPEVKALIQRADRIPGLEAIVLGGLAIGAIATSFWAKLAGRSTQSASDFSHAFRELRKNNPSLTAKQAHDIVKTQRQRQALAWEQTRYLPDMASNTVTVSSHST